MLACTQELFWITFQFKKPAPKETILTLFKKKKKAMPLPLHFLFYFNIKWFTPFHEGSSLLWPSKIPLMTVKETPAINQSRLLQFHLPPCSYLHARPSTRSTRGGCLRESESRNVRLCFGGSSLVCLSWSCLWQCLYDTFCSSHTLLLCTVHLFPCPCFSVSQCAWRLKATTVQEPY